MYVVECFSPGVDGHAVRSAGERATVAVAELRSGAPAVEYLGALLLPGDEVVFHLFWATSSRAVSDASVRAGIDFERVLESIPVGMDGFAVASSRSAEGPHR